ncbi:MAG TPA: CHRD domain-containing protein [Candidatus Dormibacteraeota bacterium]|nr:CHRD domain-containing protein [Candidatus Dormibacteraeota bacterium]
MHKRLALSIITVALAACGGHATSSAQALAQTSPKATPALSSPSALTAKMAPQNGSKAAGTVTVAATSPESFTVRVDVTGLAPGTAHPAHIHSGPCGANGAIVYPLPTMVADHTGAAAETATVHHPYKVPTTGWSVNVHQGPTMAAPGDKIVACGVLPAGPAATPAAPGAPAATPAAPAAPAATPAHAATPTPSH